MKIIKYTVTVYQSDTEFNVAQARMTSNEWKVESFNAFGTVGYNYRIVVLWSRNESIAE